MAERSLFAELRKRKVVQSAAIYVAVAWGVTEIVVTVVEQNDQGIYTAQTNPFFDNLRGDPRFEDFVERLVSGGDQKHR